VHILWYTRSDVHTVETAGKTHGVVALHFPPHKEQWDSLYKKSVWTAVTWTGCKVPSSLLKKWVIFPRGWSAWLPQCWPQGSPLFTRLRTVKNAQKFRKYTIVNWVNLNRHWLFRLFSIQYSCMFCLNPKHNGILRDFPCPFITVRHLRTCCTIWMLYLFFFVFSFKFFFTQKWTPHILRFDFYPQS
jgi:hypothetical protein